MRTLSDISDISVIVSEDTIFSKAKRLKDGPYTRAKAYLVKRDRHSDGTWACELHKLCAGPPMTDPTSLTVHHRVSPTNHQAKALGLACINCNSSEWMPRRSPSPPLYTSASQSEQETEKLTAAQEVAYRLKPYFVKRVEETLLAKGEMDYDDAVFQVAREFYEKTGRGSHLTTASYVKFFTVGSDPKWRLDKQNGKILPLRGKTGR